MQTILVTGGAGFIGSCFVRQCIAEQPARMVNFDKLTYAGNLDSLADRRGDPRYVFVHGDIADRAAVDRAFRASSRRRWSISPPSRTSTARSTARRRSSDTNVAGHVRLLDAARHYWPALRRAASGAVPLPPRFDRRGLRLAGADGPLRRGEPLRPQFALFGLEGGGRPPRPGLSSAPTACRCW